MPLPDNNITSPTLLVVTGPTAVGKTALTLRLAHYLDTEIISADSRQFYREMRIGTAMPEPSELASVKHHFIADRSVHQPLTAGEFEKLALERLQALFEKKNVAILTGGSGLYLKTLLEGMDPLPPSDPSILAYWEDRLSKEGISVLQEALRQRDPSYFEQVDISNARRLLRALTLIEQTGDLYSSLRTGRKAFRPFQIRGILLQRDREELYARIDSRVDHMMAEGLVEEARLLYNFRDLPALQTVGYQEIFQYMEGKYTISEAQDKIRQHSRNYAKRQITWFRKNGEWAVFHPDQWEEILDFANESQAGRQE